MILSKIGKSCNAEYDTVQPFLVQPMARGLHCCMGHSRLCGLSQSSVQGDWLGSGVVQRRTPCPFDASGPQIHRAQPYLSPNLPAKCRNRGFAIGTRHGHHNLRLHAKEQCGSTGQGLAWIIHHTDLSLVLKKCARDEIGALRIGQDRTGALAAGIFCEFSSMHPRAGQSCKEVTGAHLTAINRQALNQKMRRPRSGQTQICKCFALGRHRSDRFLKLVVGQG